MTPVVCQVRHDPPNSYGDCVRACVATVLNLPSEQVPHFYDAGPDGHAAHRRIIEWLAARGEAPYWSVFPAGCTLDDVLEHMAEMNPTATYLLHGRTVDGGHVVVCQGGKVVHDPSWMPSGLIGPQPDGWITMLIARQ